MSTIQKSPKGQPQVELLAYWGNDDAESTIKLSRRRWRDIQDGARYVTNAWGWYEGKRFSVVWHFADAEFTIDGDDGMQCIVDCPISELVVLTLHQEKV